MSLALRALVALVLMAGFYVLALAIATGLLWIPYAEITYAHRIHVKLVAGCVIGAFAILWSILPRPDRFAAPGPRLLPKEQPSLFRLIREVAKSTGQAPPAEVYLINEVNAWVSSRGGLMGFGSRRVMGLGLPLLRALTVSQFRAVLAHEFGHFHGGDTRLGPWVYKTRGAIGRTLSSLGDSALQWPFRMYGNLFLRVTHAISRHQELQADALAARTCGTGALAEGLRRIHGAAAAFPSYWMSEVVPVLEGGRRPPIAEGFARFLAAPRVAAQVDKGIREEIQGGAADPFDTHPPLRERLDALRALPDVPPPRPDPPALTMLARVEKLEAALLEEVAGGEAARSLKPLAWEEVEASFFLPAWQATASGQRGALAALATVDLPAGQGAVEAFARKLALPADANPTEEERRGHALHVLGSALVLAMAGAGFHVTAQPGEAVVCVREATRIEPFTVVGRLAAGELAPADWREECRRSGIESLALEPPIGT